MRSDWHRDRRPAWWPENEAWPPFGRPTGYRRAFLFRIGGVFIFALMFGTVGLARLLGWLAARAGLQLPGEAIPLFVLFLAFFLVPLLFFGGMRRFGFPLGDIVQAAERIGDGDYSTRTKEYGPPFLRKIARAFNAMAGRLEIQERRRRDLVADVAHELRTPLSVMRGRLEGLLDGVYQRDDAAIEQLIDETKLLERLVEDLRTLSHAESGTLRLQREPSDIAVLIHDVVRSLESSARTREVAVIVTAADDLPLLDIDPFRIREVLTNLITNALRHTPAGGRITVAARTQANRLHVDVEDTGSGIPADELSRVFDRFAKGADSQGSGLGLTIARNLVAAHGGEISARNRPEGGAAFTFTLPGT
jgi:signal transduction histidine kinase